jgi:hypothetical protein
MLEEARHGAGVLEYFSSNGDIREGVVDQGKQT